VRALRAACAYTCARVDRLRGHSAYSNELNAARLALLKAQDEHLQAIFAEAAAKVDTATKDKAAYKSLCEKLLLQGLLSLVEPEVTLRCREADVAVVESVIAPASKSFTAQAGRPVTVTLDRSSHLPASSGGGVELSCRGGKIRIVNTLENRLATATEQARSAAFKAPALSQPTDPPRPPLFCLFLILLFCSDIAAAVVRALTDRRAADSARDPQHALRRQRQPCVFRLSAARRPIHGQHAPTLRPRAERASGPCVCAQARTPGAA